MAKKKKHPKTLRKKKARRSKPTDRLDADRLDAELEAVSKIAHALVDFQSGQQQRIIECAKRLAEGLR